MPEKKYYLIVLPDNPNGDFIAKVNHDTYMREVQLFCRVNMGIVSNRTIRLYGDYAQIRNMFPGTKIKDISGEF